MDIAELKEAGSTQSLMERRATLEQKTRVLMDKSRARKTISGHKTAQSSWSKFCEAFAYDAEILTDTKLSQYICWMLEDQHKTPSTISTYVTGGIQRKFRGEGGYVTLSSGNREAQRLFPRSLEALEASQREQNVPPEAAAKRLKRGPVIPSHLPELRAALRERYGESDPLLAAAFWLLICMLMTGGNRPGELLAGSKKGAIERHEGARWENMKQLPASGSRTSPGAYFSLLLPTTKTSQKESVTVTYRRHKLNIGNVVSDCIDPVAALEALRNAMAGSGSPNAGYLFRSDPDRHGLPGFLTYSKARAMLKELGKAAGWEPSECFLHSFRIGLATCGAAAGLTVEDIKLLGRWKAESSVTRYVRDFLERRDELVSRALESQKRSSDVQAAFDSNSGGVGEAADLERDSDDEVEEMMEEANEFAPLLMEDNMIVIED
jgi:hypothetical protein